MYSKNRRRPSSVIRQRVWGRLLWNPFQISTKPASLQDLEVPAQVAVGEVAEFLEVGEDHAARAGRPARS